MESVKKRNDRLLVIGAWLFTAACAALIITGLTGHIKVMIVLAALLIGVCAVVVFWALFELTKMAFFENDK